MATGGPPQNWGMYGAHPSAPPTASYPPSNTYPPSSQPPPQHSFAPAQSGFPSHPNPNPHPSSSLPHSTPPPSHPSYPPHHHPPSSAPSHSAPPSSQSTQHPPPANPSPYPPHPSQPPPPSGSTQYPPSSAPPHSTSYPPMNPPPSNVASAPPTSSAPPSSYPPSSSSSHPPASSAPPTKYPPTSSAPPPSYPPTSSAPPSTYPPSSAPPTNFPPSSAPPPTYPPSSAPPTNFPPSSAPPSNPSVSHPPSVAPVTRSDQGPPRSSSTAGVGAHPPSSFPPPTAQEQPTQYYPSSTSSHSTAPLPTSGSAPSVLPPPSDGDHGKRDAKGRRQAYPQPAYSEGQDPTPPQFSVSSHQQVPQPTQGQSAGSTWWGQAPSQANAPSPSSSSQSFVPPQESAPATSWLSPPTSQPNQQFYSAPSSGSQYGAPPPSQHQQQQGFSAPPPSSSFGPPPPGSAPPSSYGPPGQQYGPPGQQYGPPSSSYGPPPPGQHPQHPPQPSYQGWGQQPYPDPSQQQPQPPKKKMDPSSFPNPTKAILYGEPTVFYSRPPVPSSQADAGSPNLSLPPPAASNYVAIDEGNCGPRYMRPTMYTVPCNADVLKTSGLPMCLCVSPLADPHPGERAVPIVDYDSNGPIRCGQCKAYLNCFDNFLSGGREYRCSLCSKVNEVPAHYFSPLDSRQQRLDIQSRPELMYGSVEYVATKDYMVRDPSPLSTLFLVDVSQPSVSSGLVTSFVNVMKRFLSSIPDSLSAVKIGIITYDTTLHFYNLNPASKQPQMLVVSEMDDLFVPTDPENLLVNVKESRGLIETLLNRLEFMFQTTKIAQASLSSAVQAAKLVLQTTGGKVVAIQRELASFGPAALKNRLPAGPMPPEKETPFYLPLHNLLEKIGDECAQAKVGVEGYFFGPQYVDTATLHTLTSLTSGRVNFYPIFPHPTERAKFEGDLFRSLTRTQGYDAVMRVRTNAQLAVQQYMGNYLAKIPTDLEVGTIDCDYTFAAQLKHNGKLVDGARVVLQCALLYTTATGQRRVRVHTLGLDSSAALSSVFRSADLDSILNALTRSCAQQVVKGQIAPIRQAMIDRCIVILTAYRKHCSQRSASGQLILPETLKLLPIYLLGLLKSPILSNSPNVSIDLKVFYRRFVDHCDLETLSLFFYPRLMDVLEVSAEYDSENLTSEGAVKQLPPLIRLQVENLKPTSIYLMDCGVNLYLWIGGQVSAEILQKILNVNRLEGAQSASFMLLKHESDPLLRRIHSIIRTLQHQAGCTKALYIVCAADAVCLPYRLFLDYFVEDRTKTTLSYVDFLCQVHRQIQQKVDM